MPIGSAVIDASAPWGFLTSAMQKDDVVGMLSAVAAVVEGSTQGRVLCSPLLTVHPGRHGAALPLQYLLAVHDLHHLPGVSGQHCPYEALIGAGDGRMPLVRIDESVPVRTPRRPRPWVAATRRVLADRLD